MVETKEGNMEIEIKESTLSGISNFKFKPHRGELVKKVKSGNMIIKVFLGEIVIVIVNNKNTTLIGKGFKSSDQALKWQKYLHI